MTHPEQEAHCVADPRPPLQQATVVVVDATPYLAVCVVAVVAAGAAVVVGRFAAARRVRLRDRVRDGLSRMAGLCRHVELIDEVAPPAVEARCSS